MLFRWLKVIYKEGSGSLHAMAGKKIIKKGKKAV